MSTETMQTLDSWILLAIAIWFIPKGLLFLATTYLSWRLTPKHMRTPLGSAYRWLFVGLFVFSNLLALLFFTRWTSGPPQQVTTQIWVAMFLRCLLLFVMAFVTFWEYRVARELVKRVRDRRFMDLDGATYQGEGLP